MSERQRRRGFTLLELIVAAMLILALVAAMALFLMDALRIRARVAEATDRARAADVLVSAIGQALETTLVEDPRLGAGIQGDATSLSVLRAGLASWRLGTNDRSRAMEEVDRIHVRFDRGARRIAIGRGEMQPSLLPGTIDRVRFRYFDGQLWRSEFDSVRVGRLPVAVEVALWLRPRAERPGPVDRPEFDSAPDEEGDGGAAAGEEEGDEPGWAIDADDPPDRLRIVTIPDAGPTPSDVLGGAAPDGVAP